MIDVWSFNTARSNLLSKSSKKREPLRSCRAVLRGVLFFIISCLITKKSCISKHFVPRLYKEFQRWAMDWVEMSVMLHREQKFPLIAQDLNVHVISLPRLKERAKKTFEALHRQGIPYQTIEAADGLAGFDAGTIERYAGAKRKKRISLLSGKSQAERIRLYLNRSTLADVDLKESLHESLRFGCYASHVLLWRNLLQRGMPFLTVLEDDVVPEPDFSVRLLNILRTLPENWDMLYLNGCYRKLGPRFGSDLVLSKGGLCTFGYAVSFNGAAKLFYRYSLKSDKPIDHMLDELVLSGRLIAFHADPPLLHTIKSLESTLAYYT